jgi:RNA polymerase sigma factor (sigma-70 family)
VTDRRACEPAPAEDFDRFFTRTLPRLLATARMACRDWHDAEDLVQDAYLTAFRSWDRIREYGNPEAWLHTVLRHLIWARSRKRAREHEVHANLPVPRDPTPEETALASAVLDALDELPPRQRAAIVLQCRYGMRQEEIAAELGVRRSTVAVSVRNARHSLEKLLDLTPGRAVRPEDALVPSWPWAGPRPADPLTTALLAAGRWLSDAVTDSPGAAQRVRAAVASAAGRPAGKAVAR